MKSIMCIFYLGFLWLEENIYCLLCGKTDSFLLFGEFTQYWQNIFPSGITVNYIKPHKILFPSWFEVSILLSLFALVGWESPVLAFSSSFLSSSSLPLLKHRNKVPAREAAILTMFFGVAWRLHDAQFEWTENQTRPIPSLWMFKMEIVMRKLWA